MLRVALALIAFGVALPSAATAQSLTLAGPMDDALVERIRGQLSDLPWTVARDPAPPPPIQAVLEQGASRVVVWVTPTARGAVLHLLDRGERRLLARAFDRPTGEVHADSTLYESLAVSLRSSLRALAAGGTIGVAIEPESESESEPESESESEAGSESASESASESESESGSASESESGSASESESESGSATFVALGVGWWGALDGASPVQTGPSGSLVVGHRALRVGAAAQLALGADIVSSEATIRLARHGAWLEVGGAFERRPVELTAALRVGVLVARRQTVGVAPPLVATPGARVVSGAVGGRIGLRLSLHALLSLRLDLGADLVAPRPRFEANGAGVAEPWGVQPFANLVLEVHALTRSGREPPP